MPILTGVQTQKCRGRLSHYPCISALLQQPASLNPFVWKFIVLLLIASRTSGNNIGNVVAAIPRKRDHMICVPHKILLGMLFMAIITSVPLTLQLLQELLSGERVASIVTSNTALVIDCLPNGFSMFTLLIGFSHLFAMLGSIVLSVIFRSLFFVLMIILLSKCSLIFSEFLITLRIVSEPFFLMLLLPLSIIFTFFFSMFLMPLLISCACACLAFASKLLPVFVEKSQGENLSTDSALFALRGVKGYTGIHGRRSFLSSRLRMFAASLGHHIITPAFYHKRASKAILYPFYCPTSNFLEA